MNTSNDPLTRRSFRITITLSSQNKQITLTNSFMNCECIEIYTIINEIIVFEVCKQLQIEPFAKKADKNFLFKNRIYSISDHKFEQVKKYLNEHLKKRFIVFNHVSFALLVLFVEKPNERLRFCVNYRKLNVIIKRNHYFISLIDEVLIRI